MSGPVPSRHPRWRFLVAAVLGAGVPGLGSAAPPAPPPPPYLERSAALAALAAVPEALASCLPADATAGLVRLRVRFHGDGTLEPVSVEDAPGAPGCWTDGLLRVRGSRHAGAPAEVRFSVPVGAGLLGTPLDVELRIVPPDPVFLHVPSDLEGPERDALLKRLGLAAEGA